MGQAPFRSPSVFNFFSPDYARPGQIADAGLVSPEFQITSETAADSRGQHVAQPGLPRLRLEHQHQIVLDFAAEQALAGDAGGAASTGSTRCCSRRQAVAEVRAHRHQRRSTGVPATRPLDRVRMARVPAGQRPQSSWFRSSATARTRRHGHTPMRPVTPRVHAPGRLFGRRLRRDRVHRPRPAHGQRRWRRPAATGRWCACSSSAATTPATWWCPTGADYARLSAAAAACSRCREASLLPIAPGNGDGRAWGLHPSMNDVQHALRPAAAGAGVQRGHAGGAGDAGRVPGEAGRSCRRSCSRTATSRCSGRRRCPRARRGSAGAGARPTCCAR